MGEMVLRSGPRSSDLTWGLAVGHAVAGLAGQFGNLRCQGCRRHWQCPRGRLEGFRSMAKWRTVRAAGPAFARRTVCCQVTVLMNSTWLWRMRKVYARCIAGVWSRMARTNIDIDDHLCELVMRRYQLKTKREAVNWALHQAAFEPLHLDEARAMRGQGWEGDLDELRGSRG